MRKIWVIVLLSCLAGELAAAPKTLQDLLDLVQRERIQEKQQLRARERKFIEARDSQKTLLQQALDQLAEEEARDAQLTQAYEQNKVTIDDQQRRLEEVMGSVEEFSTIVHRFTEDIYGVAKNSLITAQHPEYRETIRTLSESNEIPSEDDLVRLWEVMLAMIVDSGKVVRFPTAVTSKDGEQEHRPVIRIGTFNLISAGKYLRYWPQTAKTVEPVSQPAQPYRRMAKRLENTESGVVPVAIDPTRGTLLALLGQSPDLLTRLQQGGVVGYVIIGLGVIGLAISIERLLALSIVGRRVRLQLQDKNPNANNPLGRILMTCGQRAPDDPEALGYRLDEAILRELPAIQRGLGSLSMMAAMAPLLGLLGTVIGIIKTFEAITLFGTGDPRLMSGGISLALITTVVGLVVAIPLLLIHSFLSAKSNRIVQILDLKSAALVANASEQQHAV
jgi:biopolymer transport protein ExbB